MVRSLHVFLHPSFRQSVHPSVPLLNKLEGGEGKIVGGKGIFSWSRRNRRVVKASSRMVKEFEGGKGKIEGGGDIISITLF